MAYTGTEICTGAAVDLNDAAQTTFTSAVLFPFLQEALLKLRSAMLLAGIPYTEITDSAQTMSVSANVQTVAPTASKVLIAPISLHEAPVGSTLGQYILVERVESQPLRDPRDTIGQWWFAEEVVKIPPITAARAVILRYEQDVTVITSVGSNINIVGAQLYLRKKTAALATFYIGENSTRAQVLSNEADEELDKYLGIQVRNQQALPTKRIPFRRGNRWRLR